MTTDHEAETLTAAVRHLLTQRGVDARNWQRQAERMEAERDEARAELEKRTADFIRLIEETQTLMRPQVKWEAEIVAIKQAFMETLESGDQWQRTNAAFENLLLAVSARLSLAWMGRPAQEDEI